MLQTMPKESSLRNCQITIKSGTNGFLLGSKLICPLFIIIFPIINYLLPSILIQSSFAAQFVQTQNYFIFDETQFFDAEILNLHHQSVSAISGA